MWFFLKLSSHAEEQLVWVSTNRSNTQSEIQNKTYEAKYQKDQSLTLAGKEKFIAQIHSVLFAAPIVLHQTGTVLVKKQGLPVALIKPPLS